MQPVVLKINNIPLLFVGIFVSDDVNLPLKSGNSASICLGDPVETIDEETLNPLKLKLCGEKFPEDLLSFSPAFLKHVEDLKETGKIVRMRQADGYLMVNTKGTW
jgi:biotin operon repressor